MGHRIPLLQRKHQKWFWITANVQGQNLLLEPPYPSEDEAREHMAERLREVAGDIFQTDTKDVSKATQRYRQVVFNQSDGFEEDLVDSTKPMKHKFNPFQNK